MNLEETEIALAKCCRKASFWRRAVYVGLLFAVLFAVLAFSIRLSTGNYLFPAPLAGCMALAVILVCFSLYKIQAWTDKVERQSLDVSLLSSTNANANCGEDRDCKEHTQPLKK